MTRSFLAASAPTRRPDADRRMGEQQSRKAMLRAIGVATACAVAIYVGYRFRGDIAVAIFGYGIGLSVLLLGAWRSAGTWFLALLLTALAGYAVFAIARSRLSAGAAKKGWLWSILAPLLMAPFAVHVKARWPYAAFADELLADPPGARKLVTRFDYVGFGHAPGFGFEYETRVGPWLTHKYFRERLLAAGFSMEDDLWYAEERRAFYRSPRSSIACSIVWRPGTVACMPGYRRRDCDPTHDLVLGGCAWWPGEGQRPAHR